MTLAQPCGGVSNLGTWPNSPDGDTCQSIQASLSITAVPLLAAQSENLLCFSITVSTQQECVHDSKPHEQQALTAEEPRPTGLHILPAIIRSQVHALSRAIPCLLLPPLVGVLSCVLILAPCSGLIIGGY